MCGIPFFASVGQSPPLVGCPRAVRNGESARTSVVSTAHCRVPPPAGVSPEHPHPVGTADGAN